ncbi:hypothetical protein R6Q59_005499 [Mikania micrantha]
MFTHPSSEIDEEDDGDGSDDTAVAGFDSCWYFADDWICDLRFRRCDSLLCGLLLQHESSLSVNLFTGFDNGVLIGFGFSGVCFLVLRMVYG